MTKIKIARDPSLAVDGELPKVARSVAIIMDGSGRWAAARGLPVAAGHREGTRALRRTVEAAIDVGVESLAVYAFSTENWARPAEEVDALMEIFVETIEREQPPPAEPDEAENDRQRSDRDQDARPEGAHAACRGRDGHELAPAESPAPLGVLVERRSEVVAAEVRPVALDEDELGVRELPEQEV